MGWIAIIIAQQNQLFICVRADHCNIGRLFQREDSVVFQQHNAFLCHLPVESPMFLTIQLIIGNLVVRTFRVEHSQAETNGHDTHYNFINFFFRNQPGIHCLLEMLIGKAFVGIPDAQVATGLYTESRHFRQGFGLILNFVTVFDFACIRFRKALKAQLVSKDFFQQIGIHAAGDSAEIIIGGHYAGRICLLDTIGESRKVGLLQIFVVNDSIPLQTSVFRARMGRKVFQHVSCFTVMPFPLHALYICRTHTACQIWIFTIGFLHAAPARIPSNVQNGATDRQPLINIGKSLFFELVVFCPHLIGYCVAHLLHPIRVETGCHGNGLRKYCSNTTAAHAVRTFAPPVIGRDSQPVNGGSGMFHLGNFFFQRHFSNQFTGFLFKMAIISHDASSCRLSFLHTIRPYCIFIITFGLPVTIYKKIHLCAHDYII